MEGTAQPRIKICCVGSVDEAWLAIRHGAAAIGLVSEMPSGPGQIPERLIAEVAAAMPPAVTSFLLTSRRSASAIIDQQRRLRVQAIQLCDDLVEGSYRELREALPGISLVQVVHVAGEEAVARAQAVAAHVDGILLDSGAPNLPIKQLGGTGRCHDWQISRRIREMLNVPVFLAGGLNAENVGEAIATVRPFAIDVCSGVRTAGRLDAAKLSAFVQAATSAG